LRFFAGRVSKARRVARHWEDGAAGGRFRQPQRKEPQPVKKPLLFGLLWWVIVFVEVSLVAFTPGMAVVGPYGFTLSAPGVVVHFAALAGIGWGLARLYARRRGDAGASMPITWDEAVRAALVMAACGLALDAVITVPLFVKSYAHYYSKWTLWVGLVVAGSAFLASIRQRLARA
jgi:hypothetical protein